LWFISILFLKDKKKSLTVGIGMISRGEVGLIAAGIGISSGVLSRDIYTSIIIMISITIIMKPVWL
jgi:Kef-type K+ transport system membrane component KefB